MDYFVSVDLATKKSDNMDAICVLCFHCNNIIYSKTLRPTFKLKHYERAYNATERTNIPKKCPKCGAELNEYELVYE